jgi:hypothetical protein
VRDGEYPGVPGGTVVQQIWDAGNQKFVDQLDGQGRPILAPTDIAGEKQGDREAKRQAALQAADNFTKTGDSHKHWKEQAETLISNLIKQKQEIIDKHVGDYLWNLNAEKDPLIKSIDEQIATAQKERTYRQGEMDKAYGRANDANAEATGYRTAPASGEPMSTEAPPQAKGKNRRGSRYGMGPVMQSSGPTLEGALDAFRAKTKREPTAGEIANIKKHYGFQ